MIYLKSVRMFHDCIDRLKDDHFSLTNHWPMLFPSFSGTVYLARSKPSITRKRDRNDKNISRCTHTGTQETTTDTDSRRRNESETNQTIQVLAISQKRLTPFYFSFSLVARSVSRGAVEVLRDGENGAAGAHAALPGLVCPGQLREAQKETKEKG